MRLERGGHPGWPVCSLYVGRGHTSVGRLRCSSLAELAEGRRRTVDVDIEAEAAVEGRSRFPPVEAGSCCSFGCCTAGGSWTSLTSA